MRQDRVITTLADELNRRLGTHLGGLWLYGSRARGDARATSDYDVSIIREQGRLTVDWVEAAHWPSHSRPSGLIATVYRTFSPDGAPKSDRLLASSSNFSWGVIPLLCPQAIDSAGRSTRSPQASRRCGEPCG